MLIKLTSLRQLTIYETDLTDAQVADLRRALPDCEILR